MPYGEFKHFINFGQQEKKEKEIDNNDKEIVRPRRSIWEW